MSFIQGEGGRNKLLLPLWWHFFLKHTTHPHSSPVTMHYIAGCLLSSCSLTFDPIPTVGDAFGGRHGLTPAKGG